MMTIVSVLVFMLVQGRAVCDEVYPISLLEGFFVNQSEWHARDHTETQVKSIRPRPPQVSNIDCSRSISQAGAVDWITKCIVDEYKFEANENENEWISQPDFKKALGTSEFERRAGEVRKFFIQYNHWERTKKIFKKNELLMITAARYLLVTSILYTRSSFPKLTPCSRNQDRKYVIPLDGVCYPVPYGSASYKSDYDVGLIGPKSGSLTESFNIYFQSKFRKPSELVFDTNVYAFTLEFAMPSMFINLPWAFKTQVPKKEEKNSFKMQELASAYYKVFKYNSNFFGKLANGAWIEMKDPGKRQLLKEWIKIYKQMDIELGMRSASFGNNPQLLREAHNKMYQGIVKSMSVALPTPYHPKFLALLSKALIYAAEAYHTRGAIRHVVGAIQINWLDESKLSLSTNDLWVSMIENWGETNKEYNHCENENLLKCFMKMSKYMWRVLDAMTLLRERLPEELKKVNLRPCDPQFIMKMWLRYKKEERTVFTDDDVEIIRIFLKEFGCHEAKFQDLRRYAFSQSCLEKLNDKVNAYNEILAYLFSENPGKLLRK